MGRIYQAGKPSVFIWSGLTAPTGPFEGDLWYDETLSKLKVYNDVGWVEVGSHVKLDDLTAPDNNTDLNASTSLHGLMQRYPGGTATFLRSDGSFAAPTAAASISQTEVDFGVTPVANASFTITDAAVTINSRILAQVAYEAPTGKDVDEIEMDDLQIRCQPGSGQFIMFVQTEDGSYLADKFRVNYQVGA